MAIEEGFMNDDPELANMINQHIEAEKGEQPDTTKETEDTTEVVEDKKEENKDVLSNTETESITEDQGNEAELTDKVDFDISVLNRELGTEYESLDQFKSIIESSKELEGLRASLSEKDKTIQEKEELLNTKTDGLKLFATDNLYKVNQILINNPDLNQDALLKLASADLENMDDLQVLKLQRQIKRNDSSFSDADIEYAINKKYSLTGNPDELEGDELRDYNANKYLRNEDAQDARKELKTLMNVEVPEKIDLLAMKNADKEKAEQTYKDNLTTWTSKTPEIVKALDKYILEFDKGDDGKFEFAYDDEFKTYLGKTLPEYAARTNLDINKPESLQQVVKAIKSDFINQKLPQMFKAFKQDLMTKFQDEAYRKKHNIKEPENKEAPDKMTDVEKKNKSVDEKINKSLDW